MMSRVGEWTGEEWVGHVVRDIERREAQRCLGRRWVDPEYVYGAHQVDDGWHALWELTEARCRCGAIELVPWRPGHRNVKHVGALLRVQRVECWDCGEVLDLRLQRRDREAEQETERAAQKRCDQVRWGERPRGPHVGRRRWVARPLVPRRRRVVRAKVREEQGRATEPVVRAQVREEQAGPTERLLRGKVREARARATQRVVGGVVKRARRQAAIRRARAYLGGIRFKVGGLAQSWVGSREG